jgi:Co/Zn/Cd efflux system component
MVETLFPGAQAALVLWELSGTGEARQRRALRLIGVAFIALAIYLIVQSTVALLDNHHDSPNVGGIVWTGLTALIMFGLAAGERRTGRALGNPVLETEGRVTVIDGMLAAAVLAGITLDLVLGWWWADPVVGYVIVYYAVREAIQIFDPGYGVSNSRMVAEPVQSSRARAGFFLFRNSTRVSQATKRSKRVSALKPQENDTRI